MMMSTKQSEVHNETICINTYLRKFLSLDLANWSIYMETGESCSLKWSFSLTLCEIQWRFSSILPNVKISLTLCKIPWQFPDLRKFYCSLTFPWQLWTLDKLTLKQQGPFFPQNFILLFNVCYRCIIYFFTETHPNLRIFCQLCGYWWPGALAPGHQ